MRPEKILICFFRERCKKYSSSSVEVHSARKVRCTRNAQRATRLFLYHLELQLLSSGRSRREKRELNSLSLSLSRNLCSRLKRNSLCSLPLGASARSACDLRQPCIPNR